MNKVQVQPMSTFSPVIAYKTSIGKKILMALTGLIFIGFVSGHLIGNLQIFLGQDKINSYAEILRGLGGLLWFIRLFMLCFFSFHIWFGIKLWWENKSSRPVNYQVKTNIESTFASRTMIYSAALIFFFVIYHLLHFTFIVTNPEYANLHDSLGRFDVYSMIILGFNNYWISAVYAVAILFLSFHISHGLFSLFQTLGLNNPKWQPKLMLIANLYAVLIFLGYISIPAGVLFNVLKLPGGIH